MSVMSEDAKMTLEMPEWTREAQTTWDNGVKEWREHFGSRAPSDDDDKGHDPGTCEHKICVDRRERHKGMGFVERAVDEIGEYEDIKMCEMLGRATESFISPKIRSIKNS